ncbi:hypothetical protein BCR44DRAFT_126748 [Catenaria anguillulae PL171]|uniref:Uncharacterized protein n=1 Tax=Catenaria anguillulae PL171 TaxID=765915 RepID=A0A1Y2I2B4_9FUNG|nr:hypothetical protein BCR44DRAFT_126748 [Catenaria anguillulae PL171]
MVRAIRVDRNLPEYPEGIEHAISSSVALTAAHHPAGLTRKKWIRLKGRLELHADRGPRRCLTWKGCPLIIVPEDDWAQVIKSVHVLTGRPGIHASHKLTYSLIRKEYQTRRSRCGIPQEMITDFCTMCAECASGVFVTDTCPESTRNSEQDQDNDQGSGEDERGTSDEDQVDGVGGSAAGPNRPKQPAVANLSSGVTLPTLGRPGKRKATAAAASPLAPNVGGQAAEQGESGRPRAPKRQRVDTADDGTGVQAGHEDSQAE